MHTDTIFRYNAVNLKTVLRMQNIAAGMLRKENVMLKELTDVNNRFAQIMKNCDGVLGAWYFGSVSRDKSDGLSDIDIVFLIDEKNFDTIDKGLDDMLCSVCGEIVLRWEEDFNGDAIKNYCYLIRHGGKLFQYDVFLLNQGNIDDFMCQIHYTGLKSSAVIFDKNNSVEALIEKGIKGTPWRGDLHRLITTYWFHVQMSAKYLIRKDYFKTEGVLRILTDAHTSLLLSVFDRTTWGGSANKLHFIPSDMQEHLMLYGCVNDFGVVKENLSKEMRWFCDDVNFSDNEEEKVYNNRLAEIIVSDWEEKCGV